MKMNKSIMIVDFDGISKEEERKIITYLDNKGVFFSFCRVKKGFFGSRWVSL